MICNLAWAGSEGSTLCAGTLPPALATLPEIVVLDLGTNQLSGELGDFAFTTAANREDVHSTLRYLALGNNSFTGPPCLFWRAHDAIIFLRFPHHDKSVYGRCLLGRLAPDVHCN
jgi:hypothetical protein